MLKNVLAATTTIASLLFSLPSHAAPFIDIRAEWSAMPSAGMIPQGVTLSCFGDASGSGGTCSHTLTLNRTITESGTYAVSATGGIVLTNTSNQAVNGFIGFDVWLSAFNPGGPNVGLGIDDPLTQAARFESAVRGPNGGDFHRCAVGVFGEDGTVFSPTTCGVGAPDSSFGNLGVDLIDFLPGEEIMLSWLLEISATFDVGDGAPVGVPEPGAGLALMLMGVGSVAVRRRKGNSACGGKAPT